MTNELKLLHNLKAKKKNSLEKAIKIYTPYVSTVIYNTVGGAVSKEDIEEVIADTFILLWQNADISLCDMLFKTSLRFLCINYTLFLMPGQLPTLFIFSRFSPYFCALLCSIFSLVFIFKILFFLSSCSSSTR